MTDLYIFLFRESKKASDREWRWTGYMTALENITPWLLTNNSNTPYSILILVWSKYISLYSWCIDAIIKYFDNYFRYHITHKCIKYIKSRSGFVNNFKITCWICQKGRNCNSAQLENYIFIISDRYKEVTVNLEFIVSVYMYQWFYIKYFYF